MEKDINLNNVFDKFDENQEWIELLFKEEKELIDFLKL